MEVGIAICSLDEVDLRRKKVLLRLDINSPVDPTTKRITSDNRLRKSIPTLKRLLSEEAAIAIIAHQGDTLDYHNLITMAEHAEHLSRLLDVPVRYVDDVAGPAACECVGALRPGEVVLLGNLRYLTEEVSTFEDDVPLTAPQMRHTYLVRRLAPLFDAYVNDAFAAAHRNAPSMVAFQELLPSAAGVLLFDEVSALSKVMQSPERPSVFLLGGAKISDAFSMMEQVLRNGNADSILTCGVTGLVMLCSQGYDLGAKVRSFLRARSLDAFIEPAKRYCSEFGARLMFPCDLAYEEDGMRREAPLDELPVAKDFPDIGEVTVRRYIDILKSAGTIFVNGPAGIFEHKMWEYGTRELWQAIARCPGYTVVGGGDSVNATEKFVDNPKDIDYICTAGGAMVRYLSGKTLPLLAAMERAYTKEKK